MKIKRKYLQLRPAFFVIAIVVFTLGTMVMSNIKIKENPESDNYGSFPVFKGQLPDNEYSFIFFYSEDCDLCRKMRYNLEQTVAKNGNKNVHYFEANIDQFPKYYYKYNISGIPNILVFKGKKEIKRIMGYVAQENLDIIYEKSLMQ